MNIGDKVTVKAQGPYMDADERWGSVVVAGRSGIVTKVFPEAATALVKFPGLGSWYVPYGDIELPAVTATQERKSLLPADPAERKKYPIATGVLDYFPSALLEVAKVSFIGNQQHNPGQPLHWARGKSTDQEDTIIRHFLERDARDSDDTLHLAKAAWRVLAALQLKLEAEGAPIARGARLPEEKK